MLRKSKATHNQGDRRSAMAEVSGEPDSAGGEGHGHRLVGGAGRRGLLKA